MFCLVSCGGGLSLASLFYLLTPFFEIQVGNLSKIIEKINGVARCPYDPRHNSTAVITSQGELYAATVIDFSGRDPAIYRSLGNIPPLRTAQYNSKWLNGKNSWCSEEYLVQLDSLRKLYYFSYLIKIQPEYSRKQLAPKMNFTSTDKMEDQ